MIAISYRREDSLPIAGRLYDRLQSEFGKGNVFMDFDSIPYGVDFREHIKHMIDRSKVLVAIIGSDWFGKRRQRPRRIDDPTDFVRLEIAYALQRGIPVIPVLIDNMLMPKASDLPADIEALAFRNAVSLDIGIDFHHHVDRLVVGIDRLVHEARKKSASLTKDKIPDIPRQPQMPLTPGLFQEPSFPKQTSTPPPLPPKPPVPEETESTHEITNQPPPPYAVWLKHLQSGIAQAHAWITRLQLLKRKLVYGAIGLLAIIVAIAISFLEFPKRKTVPQETEQPSLSETVPFRDQSPTKIKSETATPVPAPEVIVGTIEINSSPFGQTFELIDAASNHRTGITPSVFTDVPAGYTEIIYKKDGVQEHRETVFVSADKTASVTWTYPEQTSEPAAMTVKPEPRNNRTWQVWIDEFVKQFVATSQQDTDVHLAFYASDVFYFDSPHKDQAYIRQDVEKYRERWPVRYESLERDTHLNEKKSDQEYIANYKLNFYAESPERDEWNKGQCMIDLSITIVDGIPKISSIKQKFLQREKGTGITKANPPAASPSATVLGPQSLVRFTNTKFGFSALVPAEVFPNPPKTSVLDRNLFFSTDKQTILTLFVERSARPLGETYVKWTAEHTSSQPRKIVQYKVLRDAWFVASGTDGERGFYIKGVKKGGIVVFMYLQYSENSVPLSKDTFSAMSRGFDGN